MATKVLELLQQRWSALAARERRGVVLALSLVALALLWFVLVAPALRTLGQAPLERARLDAQVQSMQAMQRRAEALQTQGAVNAEESLRALQKSVSTLGTSARVQVLGDQVTVALQATAAPALAQWLALANAQAGLAPQQMHLQRSPDSATWSGSLVFKLPRSVAP